METHTRTREHGTQETIAGNANDRIIAIRRVVENKQYEKIDGCMIDLFSASIICQVYDKLNDANKVKFASMKAPVMAHFALKLVS